ncbi:MAG: hypothetical protein ABEI58_00425 [Candidatus Nanohaloarchaea archaeon]
MAVFSLFLEVVALLLSLLGIGLIYLAIDHCTESAFVPIYYFIGLSLGSVVILSASKIGALFYENAFFTSQIVQDLFLAYVALFLFGSLWQSYEASMCIPPYIEVDEE